MKQALLNMLHMQDRMNTRVHENWPAQNFEWYRAIWIECGEALPHPAAETIVRKPGRYEVRVSHCYNGRRSTNTPIRASTP